MHTHVQKTKAFVSSLGRVPGITCICTKNQSFCIGFYQSIVINSGNPVSSVKPHDLAMIHFLSIQHTVAEES